MDELRIAGSKSPPPLPVPPPPLHPQPLPPPLPAATDLSNGRREHADDFLVWHSDNTLTIDFDNPMTNSDATTLSNASSQKTTDLQKTNEHEIIITEISIKRQVA